MGDSLEYHNPKDLTVLYFLLSSLVPIVYSFYLEQIRLSLLMHIFSALVLHAHSCHIRRLVNVTGGSAHMEIKKEDCAS